MYSGFQVVLASTSPFRKEILAKTGLQFSTAAPQVDETPQANESATQLVQRLAVAKALAVANEQRQGQGTSGKRLVIGSDQVAVVNGAIVGKPGGHAQACQQLRAASGQTVTFHTGLAVVAVTPALEVPEVTAQVETFDVVFRDLSDAEIEGYLKQEQPYNCAGSFKSEAQGIGLFHALRGDDPNTLIGLPVIRLLKVLRDYGVNPLIVDQG